MDKDTRDILIAGIPVLIAALLTFIGWLYNQGRQNRILRKSVRVFLVEIIRPHVLELKDPKENGEKSLIDKMINFVDLSKGDSGIVNIKYNPLFNSSFFQGYSHNELRLAHRKKDKYIALVNIIGYLDGFQGRLPYQVQRNWVDWVDQHKKECKTELLICQGVKHQTKVFQNNLERSKDMANHLLELIDKVLE